MMWTCRRIAVEIMGAQSEREIINTMKTLREDVRKGKIVGMKVGAKIRIHTDGSQIFAAEKPPKKRERGRLTGSI